MPSGSVDLSTDASAPAVQPTIRLPRSSTTSSSPSGGGASSPTGGSGVSTVPSATSSRAPTGRSTSSPCSSWTTSRRSPTSRPSSAPPPSRPTDPEGRSSTGHSRRAARARSPSGPGSSARSSPRCPGSPRDFLGTSPARSTRWPRHWSTRSSSSTACSSACTPRVGGYCRSTIRTIATTASASRPRSWPVIATAHGCSARARTTSTGIFVRCSPSSMRATRIWGSTSTTEACSRTRPTPGSPGARSPTRCSRRRWMVCTA